MKKNKIILCKEIVTIIKSFSNKIKVGGPSITYTPKINETWLSRLISFIKSKEITVDFISINIFPEYLHIKDLQMFFDKYNKIPDPNVISSGLDIVYYQGKHINQTINKLDELLEDELKNNVEVHITEWNVSSQYKNYINDTAFTATYIIKSILDNIGRVDSIGYLSFTDLMKKKD